MSATALAWTWILENRSAIDRISAKHASRLRLDPDDVRSATIVRLVEKHARFDPNCGTPATWIYWTVREVAQSIRRSTIPSDEHDVELVPTSPHMDETIDNRRMIEFAIASSNSGQMDAARSIAEGWSKEEVSDRLGLTLATRNARVYRLRDRILRSL